MARIPCILCLLGLYASLLLIFLLGFDALFLLNCCVSYGFLRYAFSWNSINLAKSVIDVGKLLLTKHSAQKHSAQDVGSQVINNTTSRQQNDCNSPVREKDYLEILKDICEHMMQCKHEKVREREELERKVEGM